MKVRMEAGDGNPSRLKFHDVDSGHKLGRVEQATLSADLNGATLQLTVAGETTPILKGRIDSEHGFIFEG